LIKEQEARGRSLGIGKIIHQTNNRRIVMEWSKRLKDLLNKKPNTRSDNAIADLEFRKGDVSETRTRLHVNQEGKCGMVVTEPYKTSGVRFMHGKKRVNEAELGDE
jgi:hypothetical protein